MGKLAKLIRFFTGDDEDDVTLATDATDDPSQEQSTDEHSEE